MNLDIKLYSPDMSSDWKYTIDRSKNGIFLFERNFMEYHAEKFHDLSMIGYANGVPTAVFPVAEARDTGKVASHPGLTFGGFVFQRDTRSEVAIDLVNAFLDTLKGRNVRCVTIKPIPQLFCTYPAAEAEYALWQRGFSVVRRELSSLLPLEGSIGVNKTKRNLISKAKKSGVAISNSALEGFYHVLQKVLKDRHGVDPVHDLSELELLFSRFPNNIRLYAANIDGVVISGAIVFKYKHTWHTQYLANSDMGRGVGALDLVISTVIDEAREQGMRYLSFGTSTVSEGAGVNSGLLWQKESFGARSIVHDFIEGKL